MAQERMWNAEGRLEILSESRNDFCPSFCQEWFGNKREYIYILWFNWNKMKNYCLNKRIDQIFIFCGSVTLRSEGIVHCIYTLWLLLRAAHKRSPWGAPSATRLSPAVRNVEAHRQRSGSTLVTSQYSYLYAEIWLLHAHSGGIDRDIANDVWREPSLQHRTYRLLHIPKQDQERSSGWSQHRLYSCHWSFFWADAAG